MSSPPPAAPTRPPQFAVRRYRFEDEGRTSGRAYRAALASAALFIAGVVLARVSSSLTCVALPGFFGVPLFALIGLLARRKEGPMTDVRGALRVDAAGARVEDGSPIVVLSRADLAEGWFAGGVRSAGFGTDRPASTPELHLRTRGGAALTVELEDPDDGPRALAALGLGARERALRVPLLPPAGAGGDALVPIAGGFILGFFALVAAGVTAGILFERTDPWVLAASTAATALLSALLYVDLMLLRRGEVVIGADGVSVRTYLRRRYHAHRDVERVEETPDGAQLCVRGEPRPIRLALGRAASPGTPAHDDLVRRRAVLIDRLADARAAGGGDVTGAGLAELDAVVGAPAAVRARIAELVRPEASYRRAPLAPADLEAVVVDPAAPPRRRVAAALALGKAAPDEARRAVRIATDASADEELRASLEQAAEGRVDARRFRPPR